MLTITTPAKNRLNLTLAGQIDKAAMDQGLSDLIDAADGIENGTMLYRIESLMMPTPAALAVEFGYLPKLFGVVGKFRRCAVLSDQAWLRTAAEIEGALIPGLMIKAFHLDQEAAAESWLEGDDYEGGSHSMPV
ncbi:MAG: STAS/SEC14 domain-containing protein [Pseudomonadota bacterium]